MAFQEYPKRMVHKDHTAAVFKPLTPEEQAQKGLFAAIPQLLTPERWPDVTVSNLDQEKQYASKGYRPANNSNSAAYEQAVLDQKPHDGYVYQEFPKYKYHAVNIPVVVQNAEEEAALGEGWSDSPVIASEDDIHEEQKAGNKSANPKPAKPKTAKQKQKAKKKNKPAKKVVAKPAVETAPAATQ